MNSTNKTFTDNECALLNSLIGKELTTLDACIVARGDMAWNTVRLHTTDIAIDLNNTLGEIVVDEFGTLDEFGLMSVAATDQSVLDIPEASSDTSVIPIGKKIRSVRVVNDVITVFGNGIEVAKIRYPQAVILDLGDEFLVLDKETWFEETISIKAGPNAMDLVYDDTVNWEDDLEEDPSTHYEAGLEVETI